VVLTEERVKALVPRDTAGFYVYDADVPGLALRVGATAKTWVIYKRFKGRPQRLTLGRHPTLGVKAARDAAKALVGKAAQGENVVRLHRESRSSGTTVREAFKRWSATKRALRTIDQDKRLFEIHVDRRLGGRPVADVESADVQNVIDVIGAKHPRTANKVAALLSRVFKYATKRGLATVNPVREVERLDEMSRERILSPEELRKVLKAIKQEPDDWRDYFLLLIATGARRSAVASMRWQDVDIGNGMWRVPAWASKNKRILTLPLVPEALAILEHRREDRENDCVFPSATSESGHIEEPRKPWLRVLERAEVKDVRIHDIRRTVGSWLGMAGVSGPIISKVLGHSSLRSAEPYVRLGTEAARKPLASVVSAMVAVTDDPIRSKGQ
jgi:integrase